MSVPDSDAVAATFLDSLDRCDSNPFPFRHWLLDRMLPARTCNAIDALRFTPPPIEDTLGKRETHNTTRLFFGTANRVDYPVCDAVATALQSDAVVRHIQQICDVTLAGSHLRIEYCLDTDGFWLEPHTDIGAKLFTMLVYLSDGADAENWGTDLLLDARGTLVGRASGAFDTGLIFIPAADTWHGFAPRLIDGIRRTLIINYVRPEWRARHELCFPDMPVTAA